MIIITIASIIPITFENFIILFLIQFKGNTIILWK